LVSGKNANDRALTAGDAQRIVEAPSQVNSLGFACFLLGAFLFFFLTVFSLELQKGINIE
jgi:hypothetical protein